MALADLDGYLARLSENRVVDFQMSTIFGAASRLCYGWRVFVPAPLTPGASVAVDKTNAESLGAMPSNGGGRLTALGARLNPSSTSGQAVFLVDLLNVSGGLSGNVSTEQVLNTAVLTRHTDGNGVMGGITVFSTLGTTATTFTVSYVNQNGDTKTSTATTIGATGFRESGRFIPIPLAAGDTGMRRINSVTLAAGTGSAGAFGYSLYKPLAMFACNDVSGAHAIDAITSGGFIGALAEIHPDACLSILGAGIVSQSLSGAVLIAEV
jgi:hypothetical protein